MKIITNNEEKEEQEVKRFEPKLIMGGKEPPADFGSDWLTPMEAGSVFFVQSKSDPMDFSLGLFRKVSQDDKVAVLESPQLPQEVYVNPNRFCNRYIKYQSCGIIEIKEIGKENHDERDRISDLGAGKASEVERPGGEPEGNQDPKGK